MRPLLAVLLISACMPHGLPPPEAPLGPRSRTEVVTRDGVALFTKVRLPGGDGPFPTVLVRAPYPMDPFLDWKCRVFNRHGYACVYQDTRGRGRSEGEWLPFEHEPDDEHQPERDRQQRDRLENTLPGRYDDWFGPRNYL